MPPNKSLFESAQRGYNYGTNSRKIYLAFCLTLGWDKSKEHEFGWGTWMYAGKSDTERTRDVWFIRYSNYTGEVCKSGRWLNTIKDNLIFEVASDSFPKHSKADRIVFAYNSSGYYEFLGVYKIIKATIDGRIYERISESYPIT